MESGYGNCVEHSAHCFLAECSDKRPSAQYLRPNIQPIYHQVQVQVEQLAQAMTQRQSRLSLAQAHALIYGRLKTSFQVGSYKETPDERFEEIMRYLRDELQQVPGASYQNRANSSEKVATESGCTLLERY